MIVDIQAIVLVRQCHVQLEQVETRSTHLLPPRLVKFWQNSKRHCESLLRARNQRDSLTLLP